MAEPAALQAKRSLILQEAKFVDCVVVVDTSVSPQLEEMQEIGEAMCGWDKGG